MNNQNAFEDKQQSTSTLSAMPLKYPAPRKDFLRKNAGRSGTGTPLNHQANNERPQSAYLKALS